MVLQEFGAGGGRPPTSVNFYKVVVQEIILFGS